MSLARGVILGEQAAVPTIIVPSSAERPVVGKCTVPGCDLVFYAGEEVAWQRHVGPCARANLDKIRAVMREQPVFSEDNWDPELAKHMRGVGKRMLKEGRLEVKPHERAGFS